MRRSRIVAVLLGLVASLFLVAPAASAQRAYPTCNLPESDAEALYILNAFYPNRYVWDDADHHRGGPGGPERRPGIRGRGTGRDRRMGRRDRGLLRRADHR